MITLTTDRTPRALSSILESWRVDLSDLAMQQFWAEVGERGIQDAMMSLEQAIGSLDKAVGDIEHDEEMHPPPQLWCGQRMLTEAAE